MSATGNICMKTEMAKQILLFIIVFIALPTANSFEHSPCLTNCQSSEIRRQCDTLYCKNGCLPGWYGAQCTKRCSPQCLEALCDRKSGRCTIGCKRTWMTQRHYRQCQANISRRSTRGKCLRNISKNGTCECCEYGYRGDFCEIPCTTCVTIPDLPKSCDYICKSGYYGDTCEKECPNTCELGNQGKPVCTKSQTDDSFECQQCHSGKYGTKCEKSCSLKCKNKTCYQLGGSCVHCKENYFGEDCDKNCSRQCIGGCHRNGTCVSGCKPGFQGQMCNIQCVTNCTDCSSTDTEACVVNCDDNCPIKECYPNQTCTCQNDDCSGCWENICYILSKDKKDNTINQATESSSDNTTVIAVVLVVAVCGIIIIIIIIIIMIKRRRRRRREKTAQHNESDLEPLRDTDANRSENAGIASGGSDLESLRDTDANRSQNAGIQSGGSDLEPLMATEANSSLNAEKAPGALENISELGRTLKAAVLIFIVFDPMEKAIEDKLQKTTKHPIKDDANEFTSGEMGSQIVIMIKIKKALANSDITRYLGAFDSAGHVLIVGMCRSDESDLQNNDSMTSATDNIPCIYYGSSIVLDERTFEASNHILGQITNTIANNKPRFNLRSRENTDEHVRAFDREIKPLLESVEGNVTESFMIIHGITSNLQDSAASNAAAEFVSEIITKLDNKAIRVENPNASV